MEKVIGRSHKRRLPHARLMALCVGSALAQMAVADSGSGVDTVAGNAMNPRTVSSIRETDPDGLGQNEHSRSPSGLMTLEPSLVRDPTRTESGWTYVGSTEVGVLGGDANRKNATFRKYKDLDNGLYLNNLSLELEKPDAARFLDLKAGGVGRDDQFYSAQFGRYNDWKIKAFYSETTHVFTDTFKSFWSGIGSRNLTLPAGIPPAGAAVNTPATQLIADTVRTADNTEIGLVRKKGGVRLDMTLPGDWKVFAAYSDERREGARPFGATWGGGGGSGTIEIVEPIKYDTHDFLGGVQYADKLNAFNATVSASLFRNDINTLNFERPFLPAAVATITGPAPGAFTNGRTDLYPDNNFFNAKLEYARVFPGFYNSRFTGVLSRSSLRQDDRLIAPATVAGIAVNGAADGQWNTTNSLSQKSADAKIDTTQADLGLSFSPTSALDIKGKFRYYETDNSTSYLACNPLTGQFGRLINDGTGNAVVAYVNTSGAALSGPQTIALNAFLAGNGCNVPALRNYLAANGLRPSAGNINIRGVPFEYKQLVYTLAGDYKLNRDNTINLSAEREEYKREHRERDKTWEHKFKLGYVNRSLEGGTLRLSYEHDRRRGDAYNADPYEEFYSASLAAMPTTGNVSSWIHSIDQFRKHDLADRDQNTLNARFNYMIREDLDGGISLQLKDIDYPDSDYGRKGTNNRNSLNFDLAWRPSSALSLNGFYSFQTSRTAQANVWPNVCAIGATYTFWSNGVVNTGADVPGATAIGTTAVTAANWESVCEAASPSNPLYPTSRAWSATQKDRNHVLGMGFKYDFPKASLSLDYTYTGGKTELGYKYNGAALAMTPAQIAAAGSGWPDMTFKQHVVAANLMIPVNKTVAVRLLFHYEHGRISDWHYDGVAQNPTPGAAGVTTGTSLYLDTGPKSYSASVVGVFLRLQF